MPERHPLTLPDDVYRKLVRIAGRMQKDKGVTVTLIDAVDAGCDALEKDLNRGLPP